MKDDKIRYIENGTVIDRIPCGFGMLLIKLLKLNDGKESFFFGRGFRSSQLGTKDMIKIEGRYLNQQEVDLIFLIAPDATISIIKDLIVAEKMQGQIPKEVLSIVICPNEKCITNHEPGNTHFHIIQKDGKIILVCHFCEKEYPVEQVKFSL